MQGWRAGMGPGGGRHGKREVHDMTEGVQGCAKRVDRMVRVMALQSHQEGAKGDAAHR